jgi:hypothetical protein
VSTRIEEKRVEAREIRGGEKPEGRLASREAFGADFIHK